jgi:hypothetical protein
VIRNRQDQTEAQDQRRQSKSTLVLIIAIARIIQNLTRMHIATELERDELLQSA